MTYFLFPGQGSQVVGMGRDFYEASQAARAVLDKAEEVLGPGFLDTIFEGEQEQLNDTRMAQPALVAVGAAIARHLIENGVRPSGFAGHSIGEITALTAAESLSLVDALRITRLRALFMSEGVPPGGMAAVTGIDAAVIADNLPEEVNVANYNGPQQTIISGTEEGLAEAEKLLKAAGARRVIRLQVSGPFHSPYMKDAAEKFSEELKDVTFKPPNGRFISSVSGSEEPDPDHIRELLGAQAIAPVRWTQVLQCIGPAPAVEAGPGKVLQGIAKRMEGAPTIALAGTLEQAGAVAQAG